MIFRWLNEETETCNNELSNIDLCPQLVSSPASFYLVQTFCYDSSRAAAVSTHCSPFLADKKQVDGAMGINFFDGNCVNTVVKCLMTKELCVCKVQARDGGRYNDPGSSNAMAVRRSQSWEAVWSVSFYKKLLALESETITKYGGRLW